MAVGGIDDPAYKGSSSEVKERACVYQLATTFLQHKNYLIFGIGLNHLLLSRNHRISSNPNCKHYTTGISLFLDNTCPTDSRGRASPPGEASSGELPGEFFFIL